jgi:hypothetical protein
VFKRGDVLDALQGVGLDHAVQDAVAAGRLTIRSAYCDIGSGVVTLL